jgi:hypothetical protein
VAPATAVQLSETWKSPATALSTVAAEGPAGQPEFVGAGAAQAIPCRLKALKSAVMCGVPSARLPLSSSAVSHCM